MKNEPSAAVIVPLGDDYYIVTCCTLEEFEDFEHPGGWIIKGGKFWSPTLDEWLKYAKKEELILSRENALMFCKREGLRPVFKTKRLEICVPNPEYVGWAVEDRDFL